MIARASSIRENLFIVMFENDTLRGRVFDKVLFGAIVSSVLLAILESVSSLQEKFSLFFTIAEWVITCLFTIEYMLRVYAAKSRRNYIFSFYGLVDILAILPSFFGLFIQGTHYLIIIRSLRLLRVFRIFKLTDFIKQGNYLTIALRSSLDKIVVFTYVILILVIILGAMMYVIEGKMNPSFSNIPKSIYWAIVTITTVGYGDITPITTLGQMVSAVVMLLGYAILAVPTGIITAEMLRGSKKKIACQKCGLAVHEVDAIHCKRCGTLLNNDVIAF